MVPPHDFRFFVADHVSSETFAPKTLTPTGNTQIVCLIYTPDGSVRGRHEGVVQQIDLMPTLLGLLGYDKPYFAFGRDVLHETGRTAMATNSAGDIYQGITDSLVLFFDGERTTSAYLRSDTLQRQDVSDRRTPLLEEAERQLKARLQQVLRNTSSAGTIWPPSRKLPRPAAPSGSAGALPDPQDRSRDIGCPPIFTRRPSRMLFAETGNAPGKKPLFRNILCRRAKAETKIGNRRYAPYRKTDGPLP